MVRLGPLGDQTYRLRWIDELAPVYDSVPAPEIDHATFRKFQMCPAEPLGILYLSEPDPRVLGDPRDRRMVLEASSIKSFGDAEILDLVRAFVRLSPGEEVEALAKI